METKAKYGLQTHVNLPFAEAVERVTEALKAEGFGVLTEIDMKATFKKKLDVEIEDYTILGACNPNLAYQALQNEQEIGLLLPCNVLLYTQEGVEGTQVSILNPALMVQMTENEGLSDVASEATSRLQRVIDSL